MDSIDWMFICIKIAVLGLVGARYFEYKAALEERNYRCNQNVKGNRELPFTLHNAVQTPKFFFGSNNTLIFLKSFVVFT